MSMTFFKVDTWRLYSQLASKSLQHVKMLLQAFSACVDKPHS